MITDGLVYSGQRNAHLRVMVEENGMTRIGALCFVRKREPHQERAAEEFKSLYEARYGGMGSAIDASHAKVDTSPIAHDSGMAAKIDRTWKIKDAEDRLGKPAFNRLVSVLVLCIPAGEGLSWRPRKASVDALLGDLESLSTLWGYQKRAA